MSPPEGTKVLLINTQDNVATALEDIAMNTLVTVQGEAIEIQNDISFGHKFAVRPIAVHDYVIKYGAHVGIATADIAIGEHVHVHNVRDVVDEVRKSGRAEGRTTTR